MLGFVGDIFCLLSILCRISGCHILCGILGRILETRIRRRGYLKILRILLAFRIPQKRGGYGGDLLLGLLAAALRISFEGYSKIRKTDSILQAVRVSLDT